ncbi:MAG: hypothetical protein RIQ46_529 [Pseudomonadota bacterium]|jgi:hypothetical protein
MGLFAAILLSQAVAAPPAPPPSVAAGLRVVAMARVEILAVGRAGPAEAEESRHRTIRQEGAAAMTVFE